MPTPRDKARAWHVAAMHLEAICQDKRSEDWGSDDRAVWEYIGASVVPYLFRRAATVFRQAAIIEQSRRERGSKHD